MQTLSGKVAVVTGASRGAGRAGATVMGTGRDDARWGGGGWVDGDDRGHGGGGDEAWEKGGSGASGSRYPHPDLLQTARE